jgi:integrase/recombinase XerD
MGSIPVKAGLDPREVSPHMLRHMLAKSPLANGSPLTEVQATLGHAHISSTAIYTQPSEEEKANALARAAEDLWVKHPYQVLRQNGSGE